MPRGFAYDENERAHALQEGSSALPRRAEGPPEPPRAVSVLAIQAVRAQTPPGRPAAAMHRGKTMTHPATLVLTALFCLGVVPARGDADIGKKPIMTLTIQHRGARISGEALVCYDAFMAGGPPDQASKDYPYIKSRIEHNTYTSCRYCSNGECLHWFYERPTRIAILFPVYGAGEHLDDAAETALMPKLYESRMFHLPQPFIFDYHYEATLHPDGAITLTNHTPLVTSYGASVFGRAFIITLGVESISAFAYLVARKNARSTFSCQWSLAIVCLCPVFGSSFRCSSEIFLCILYSLK